MSSREAALFITYDGLLDPLGGSQILPYLRSISAHPRPLHIVSFEKEDRFRVGAAALRTELENAGIGWTPVAFTSGFGKVGKLWDLFRMYLVCVALQLKMRFSIIHCRSYQAMQVGSFLSALFGVKTIFDMRGLWVDERVDGGLWNVERLSDLAAYRVYKRIERRLLYRATHVVALTDRVVTELRRLSPKMKAPVTVIPCCADFDFFSPLSAEERSGARAELALPEGALVISYLGSLGTWYMLEEMLDFFGRSAKLDANVHLLIITRDWRKEHEQLVDKMGLSPLRGRIHVHAASRDAVRRYLGCTDVMLSFIKPAYSKMASSPTKLAEAFALGVPAISNVGVGDVDGLTETLQAGALVDFSKPESIDEVIHRLSEICRFGGDDLRRRAREELGLEVAKARYRAIYDQVEGCA
ncbi:MAG TPA: glycosyltransferase [Terriglobales bacterium]|nr:glycosyltransferase [Terriglobales bacterium]